MSESARDERDRLTEQAAKRKPNRRNRVDQSPAVVEWMEAFIERTELDLGVKMTLDQAADAFVAWAFKDRNDA